MEQICKIGGERSRNRDVVDEDRISELPEALLEQILSSLPTKTIIATSVLSKRWRSIWKTVPKLKFDYCNLNAFSDNVYSSLVLHKAPFLESLYLKIRVKDDASDIGILIGVAFARHVRKLVLNVQFVEEGLARFPRVLCSSNNTLEILKLKYYILLAFPSPVCLTSLRKLHLHYVKFEDEDSVCNLLSGCLRLEDLVVNRESFVDVQTFSITVPSLQRLTVKEDNHAIEKDGGYVVDAPSLKYLNISSINGLEYFLIENMPELVEAHIIDVSYIAIETILVSLTSAKRLTLHLSPLEIKYPIGSSFCQLVSLELCTSKVDWWILLGLMLKSSPKLQILKLIRTCLNSTKDPHVGRRWNHPTCVPECLLFHLETFVWKRYKWQRVDEKHVATYILKNARRLKNATFSTKPIKPGKLAKFVKKREMLDELARVVRASSNSCHLVFKSE